MSHRICRISVAGRRGGPRRSPAVVAIKVLPEAFTADVELLVDVLNALNETAAEAPATDNLSSPNFDQPAVFVDPRRAMPSARLNLGR